MSMRAAIALVAALATGCGQGSQVDGLPFELSISRALFDQVGSFQVVVVSNGRSLSCADVQKTCLADQVPSARMLEVRDARGKQGRAAVFPADLKAGAPATQDITVAGVEPGMDYAVVIEALSKDVPPRLLGSSCNYVPKLEPGTNSPLLATTITALAPVPSCDPRVQR